MTEMHPSAARVVDLIASAGKVIDWVGDFQLLADLDRLAREQDAPPSSEHAALLDTPMTVGRVTLHRLSLGAVHWYQHIAKVWWGDDKDMLNMALVWAHAHSRDPDAIEKMSINQRGAKWALKAWALTRGVPWEAMMAAVDALLPPRSQKVDGQESDGQANTMSLVARLVSQTGLPETYWLYGCSNEHVVAAIREVAEKSHRDQARMAALLGVRLSDAEESWAVQSFIRFRHASRKLLAKYEVEPKRTFQTLEKEVG